MKSNLFKQALSSVLLAGALTVPMLAFADADTVQAINEMNSNLGSKLDAGSASLLNIDTSTKALLDKANDDISRKDLGAALINYEAAARVKQYQLEEELRSMVAPGSDSAMKAGKDVKAANVTPSALATANRVFAANMGMMTGVASIHLGGQDIDLTPFQQEGVGSRISLYNDMKDFITNGDTSKLGKINPGALLLTNNLATAVPAISQDETVGMINMLTNPFASGDPSLHAKIKKLKDIDAKDLEGADMEAIAEKAAEYAVVGMSSSVLAGIVSRRTPTDAGQPTVMEIMEKHAKERFTDNNWYEKVSTASDTALLREIAQMQAYVVWQQFQQFRIQEEQLALLASLNAVMGKVNSSLNLVMKQMQVAMMQAQVSANKFEQDYKEHQKDIEAAAKKAAEDAANSSGGSSSGGN